MTDRNERVWRRMDDVLLDVSNACDEADLHPPGHPGREAALDAAISAYDAALFRAMQLLGMTTKQQDRRAS